MGDATLQSRFHALWRRAVGTHGADAAWPALDAGYSTPSRAYHNWSHIAAMLAGLDEARHETVFAAVDFDAVELAIFFHDAIYDARAKDNEARSANLFHDACGDEPADQTLVRRVTDLILATAKHGASSDIGTRLLLDLDLRVLGGTPEQYGTYADAVRTEYSFVPDGAWRDGRSAVLRTFLERERIFQTDTFASRYERQARSNIERELDTLAKA
jgi:predicted metal-dependent HD superfamily phosphohydrolase